LPKEEESMNREEVNPQTEEILILDLIPFDVDDRILEEPIHIHEYMKKRLEKRNEWIQNEKGLTYTEILKWMKMLKKQRTFRMKRGILSMDQTHFEKDIYLLDGRLIYLGAFFKHDTNTIEIKKEHDEKMAKMEMELLGFVELDGTKEIS
jgi:hypothetical protein